MSLTIRDAEVFGVTESSITLSVAVHDAQGPVDASITVRLNGVPRARCEGTRGTHLIRIEGLAPETSYRIEIEAEDAEPTARDAYFPEQVTTLPAPAARQVASFATLNDLHFGEAQFGGRLLEDGEYGPEAPGYPAVYERESTVPYWLAMNEDAVADIDAIGVDATIVKGDIADRGLAHQFEIARRTLDRLRKPWHGFLGNHDHYGPLLGETVDGYALLGQPPAPRTLELGGWCLVFVDTVEPGQHHGVFPAERRAWLEDALDETRERDQPTLVFMHHQPVPPERHQTYPNSIGLVPADSVPFFELIGRHPQVRAVLIGHTHRNRVRLHPASGPVPYVEVNCVKDYPGGFGHYRLFEDGSFRQEVRRTSSPRALAHSTRCRDFFAGRYRDFALGRLIDRSFATASTR